MQRFVSLIIQNINPEKEGKTVNWPADVKSELRIITMEDDGRPVPCSSAGGHEDSIIPSANVNALTHGCGGFVNWKGLA